MDAPCNLQESIHVLVTKYLFVSSFWGTHQRGHILFYFLHAAQTAAIREKSTPGRRLGPAAAIRPAAAFSIDPKTPYSSAAALSRRREIT